MKRADTDRLIEWAIIWDRPRLAASADSGASEFLRIMRLDPDFDRVPDTRGLADAPPLTIAADGIRLELNGDTAGATDRYNVLADGAGLSGLLGKLLLAWMATSGEESFARVTTHLEGMSVRPNIAARVHMKLMTWAKDRGWQGMAREEYLRALNHSRGELRTAIRSQGHWFGEHRVLTAQPLKSDLVLFPWILDRTGRAAEVALEDATKRLAESPWTTRWRFGGPDGAEIQSAELQAEWAGAHWLLPQLWRLHASLILNRTEDARTDVPRALTFWIKGNGANVERLVDRFEGLFKSDTASQILVEGLRLGSVLRGEAEWTRVCGALWDQIPQDLAEKITQSMDLQEEWVRIRPNPTSEESLSLFAVLSLRCPEAWAERFMSLSPPLKNLVLRYMSRSVVEALPEEVLHAAAVAALSESKLADESDVWWTSRGWDAVARLVLRLGDVNVRNAFELTVPDSAIPSVVEEAGLLPPSRIVKYLDTLVRGLDQTLEQLQRGVYAHGGTDPSVAAVRCMVATHQIHGVCLDRILELATNSRADTEQVRGALVALGMAVDAGLIDADIVEPVLHSRSHTGRHSFWGEAVGARIELAERAALSLRFSDKDLDQLVASTRDPDVRVRQIGMGAIVSLSAKRASAAFDACIVGALYDPEFSVQALGVRAVTHGSVLDPVVGRICWARLLEMWAEAHRVVRATIADGIARQRTGDDMIDELRSLAANDRSAMVRRALVDGGRE